MTLNLTQRSTFLLGRPSEGTEPAESLTLMVRWMLLAMEELGYQYDLPLAYHYSLFETYDPLMARLRRPEPIMIQLHPLDIETAVRLPEWAIENYSRPRRELYGLAEMASGANAGIGLRERPWATPENLNRAILKLLGR